MIAAIPINANIKHHQPEERPASSAGAGPFAVPDPTPPPDPTQEVDWNELVCRIQKNEPDALEELYHLISRGIKVLIVRQLGRQEAEDRVHDTFLVVVRSIQKGELREPERLIAFARTVVRRRILQYMTRPATAKRDNLTGEAVTWIPGSVDAVLFTGATRGDNLRGDGADGDAVSIVEIAGQEPFCRGRQEENGER